MLATLTQEGPGLLLRLRSPQSISANTTSTPVALDPDAEVAAEPQGGAQRATQTLACFLAGMGRPQPCGVSVHPSFRSAAEERWFEAAKHARGKDLEAFRKVDPDPVDRRRRCCGSALATVFYALPRDGRALVVGHSPTTEARILGLTAQSVPPVAKGDGVRVVEEDGRAATASSRSSRITRSDDHDQSRVKSGWRSLVRPFAGVGRGRH